MKEDMLDLVALGRQWHLSIHRLARKDALEGAARCNSRVGRQGLAKQQRDEASCVGHGDFGYHL